MKLECFGGPCDGQIRNFDRSSILIGHTIEVVHIDYKKYNYTPKIYHLSGSKRLYLHFAGLQKERIA